MWEYNRIESKFKAVHEISIELNKLGADGWEIISYQETKPPKFGDDWEVIVFAKRLKPV